MSRDGSGNYSLAAGNPVVTGTSISSTWANNTMNDLASALTQSVSKDGQTTLTGTLNLGNNAITNVASLSTNTITSAALTFSGSVTGNSFIPNGAAVPSNGLYLSAANTLALSSNTTLRWSVNATGNHVIAAPSAGTALAVSGVAAGNAQTWSDGTVSAAINFGGSNQLTLGTTTNHTLNLVVNSTAKLTIGTAGNITTAAPTSGVGLTVAGFAGTHSTKIQDSAGAALNAGYLEIPQNIQNAAYAPVLADAGKHIYHSDGTARTYTIPANASVAYPIGTTLTFVNDASAGVNVTIAITTDTLYWAADGTTGSRTLARYGIATALKVTATRWSLSGTGIS